MLDLFAGKGTITLAATTLKRQALAAEANPYHFHNAKRRIDDWMARQHYVAWKPIAIKGLEFPNTI